MYACDRSINVSLIDPSYLSSLSHVSRVETAEIDVGTTVDPPSRTVGKRKRLKSTYVSCLIFFCDLCTAEGSKRIARSSCTISENGFSPTTKCRHFTCDTRDIPSTFFYMQMSGISRSLIKNVEFSIDVTCPTT